ncbi:MAG: methyltransferase domain-containing protein [Deltaproteobacteria bacterium]|nr:methyltransferase domain-containing protein [Deltaproteobacteria bacterium]
MTNFSEIAVTYEKDSLVQKSASDRLFDLLRIENADDVLDIGCGTGNLTRRIADKTRGRVAGIDASERMIDEARQNYADLGIKFEACPVEHLPYMDSFDVIFCNSAFQWFRNPESALKSCFGTLRHNGRMGMQAPARHIYSPNFMEAVENVKTDPRLMERFASFQAPWLFLETPEEYRMLFEKVGFQVLHSRIERVVSTHRPEEVFRIFDSGASAGYLNPEFYRLPISDDYAGTFRKVIEESFERQANANGLVDLVFFRIYLLARKQQKTG